jgi:hypothetical protein
MADLDQGGTPIQAVVVDLGPSLGGVSTLIGPQTKVVSAGTFTIVPGTSTVLVNAAGPVTLLLPSASAWVLEPAYQPATAFDRSLWIKDYGGNAAAFHITITPNGTDVIDNATGNIQLITNFQVRHLIPLLDLTGWFLG